MDPAAGGATAAAPGTDPGDQEASLRERKKRATRAALRRSAVELVATRGLAAVTVEDIAAAADVSPRTFFNYFPSKEDAVTGWDPSVLADMVARLLERPPGEAPPTALRTALLEVFLPFDAEREELLARLALVQTDPHLLAHHVAWWGETERLLVAALAERRGTDPAHDRYAALVVAAVLGACRVAMLSWCDRKGGVPMADELAYHLDVLAAGLAEPERSTP